MNNPALTAGLLLAAFGLALGFAPRRIAAAASLACAGMALASTLAVAPAARGYAYFGCWASLTAASVIIYWPHLFGKSEWPWLTLAANCGIWAGLVLSGIDPTSLTLAQTLSPLLLAVPAVACVDRGWSIVPRVATGWLLAVALLAGAMSQIVEHPGYLPDHRE